MRGRPSKNALPFGQAHTNGKGVRVNDLAHADANRAVKGGRIAPESKVDISFESSGDRAGCRMPVAFGGGPPFQGGPVGGRVKG